MLLKSKLHRFQILLSSQTEAIVGRLICFERVLSSNSGAHFQQCIKILWNYPFRRMTIEGPFFEPQRFIFHRSHQLQHWSPMPFQIRIAINKSIIIYIDYSKLITSILLTWFDQHQLLHTEENQSDSSHQRNQSINYWNLSTNIKKFSNARKCYTLISFNWPYNIINYQQEQHNIQCYS